ncbi:MAG: hypothetical protein ACRCWR_09640 [Saezia sp.]
MRYYTKLTPEVIDELGLRCHAKNLKWRLGRAVFIDYDRGVVSIFGPMIPEGQDSSVELFLNSCSSEDKNREI